MGKKKKNRNLCSRFKRMRREGRLASAKCWLPKYGGDKLLRAYRKRYGVDFICAIGELETLGITFDPARIAMIKKSIEGHAKGRARKKAEREQGSDGTCFDSDENFSFIAGYTSGGAPYGTPWD
jgi:hypothetical protein